MIERGEHGIHPSGWFATNTTLTTLGHSLLSLSWRICSYVSFRYASAILRAMGKKGSSIINMMKLPRASYSMPLLIF